MWRLLESKSSDIVADCNHIPNDASPCRWCLRRPAAQNKPEYTNAFPSLSENLIFRLCLSFFMPFYLFLLFPYLMGFSAALQVANMQHLPVAYSRSFLIEEDEEPDMSGMFPYKNWIKKFRIVWTQQLTTWADRSLYLLPLNTCWWCNIAVNILHEIARSIFLIALFIFIYRPAQSIVLPMQYVLYFYTFSH